jgi:hypothetical protein
VFEGNAQRVGAPEHSATVAIRKLIYGGRREVGVVRAEVEPELDRRFWHFQTE